MKLPCLLGILSFALITQASGAGLSLSPSSASVGPNGGTYSFFVNESHSSFGGNDDWYWIREASWVSPQESINQDGDQTFTYIVAPNPSISSRSTRIRVVKDGGAFNSNVTRYHTITQAGLVPTLSLSSSSRTFSSQSGGGSFSVISNTSWRWSGKPSWVTANESSGQNGNQLFSYSVQSNTSTSSRSATLTFTTTSGGNAITRTHRITQDPAPAPALTLSTSSRDFSAAGGNFNIQVSSNTSWRWSGRLSWVTANESTTQNGTQTFSYTVRSNTSTSSRSATLTFATTSGGNAVTRTHRITQDPAPALTLSTSSRDVSATGGNYGFGVTSNTSWRWSGRPTWVSSTESTTQNGSTTFSYSVSANTTASSRNATLSFITTSGGNAVARTHRISQEGAPDTVPPVITRIGPPTSTIEASWIANYIDAGATCLDEVDGVLSHAVEVSGQVVNLRHPGTYTIRYNCEDSSGNEADEIIRTVTVKDTLPPVITLAGDDTLTTEAGFPYQDPGAGAEDSLDGDVNVSVDDSSMDTGVVGSHTVTYTATDAAGNVAELTRTVNVIVTQAPAITNLAGAGVPKTLNALSITFASYLNASYILECSRDLLNWEQVREVQGAAQSTTVTIDEPILDGGGVYYRLGVKL